MRTNRIFSSCHTNKSITGEKNFNLLQIRCLLLFTLLIPVFSQIYAANPKVQAANELYKRGKYDEAILSYESQVKAGYSSPELFYNLANGYYKAKKIAPAILYYEKAKLLAPDDDDINFNLELARNYTVDKINVIPQFFLRRWLKSTYSTFDSNTWSGISIVAFLLLLSLLTIYFFTNRLFIKKLGFWTACIFFIVSASGFYFAYKQKQMIEAHTTAIVFSPSVTLKSSPDEHGNNLFTLHEGTKVTIIDQVSNWTEIRISDGSTGWLEKTDINVI
jgi:tetratricopeptide (TPR) repeat protein